MKIIISILLTVAFLWAVPSVPFAAPKEQASLTVRFADGVEIEIIDWIFEYEYGTSDKPVSGFSFYTPSYHKTQDLMIAISKTERGVTLTDEKRISPGQLKSIKFEYDDISFKKNTIQLTNGEVFEVNQLYTPKNFLTKANYIFEEKLYLKGTALVNNRKGEFAKKIYPMFHEKDIKERIVEITFGKKIAQ